MRAASSGAGRRWPVAREPPRGAAQIRANTRRIGPNWAAKIHILVDQRGAPLAIDISGANQHDKWSVTALVFHSAVKRPNSEPHFCADKGYDFADVRHMGEREGYIPHIQRKRRRGEPSRWQPRSGARRNAVPSPALGSRNSLYANDKNGRVRWPDSWE